MNWMVITSKRVSPVRSAMNSGLMPITSPRAGDRNIIPSPVRVIPSPS